MSAPLLRTRWRRGRAAGHSGGVVVSLTEFAFRWPDVPGIARAGRHLSPALLGLDGAVGLGLYFRPARGCLGSVSAWVDEADLRAFVALPEHVAIMRHYRDRGSLRAATWRQESLDLARAFGEAERRLAG